MELEKLAILICGNRNNINWNSNEKKSDFFYLKGVVKSLTEKIGFKNVKSKPITKNNIREGETISFNKSEIASFGLIEKNLCQIKTRKCS